MNKTFRSVWNASKQAYVAAAETVSAKGKPSSGIQVAAIVTGLLGSLLGSVANAQTAPPATALPTGGQVSAGQASINQSGAHMVINQSTNRAAINWQTFNVGSDAHVQFVQPNSQSVALNRVQSANPSQIFGQISANGQVILTNPSGVYFSPSSRVDVGALMATTHSITDANFMAGNLRFERNGSTGSVVNEGELKAALGGYIALLAPEVRNQGAVIAHMGTVALASGEAVDLSFDSNNRLTSLRVEASQIQALVDNQRAVQAPGGLVIISAQSMDRLVGGVVKNSGVIEATGLQQLDGRIVLSGSTKAENSGSLNVSNAQGPGGNVSLQGEHIELKSGSRIDATGSTGGGTVLVGGNWQGTAVPLLLATGQPTQQATTVTMAASATIDASATQQGKGGTVVLWSDLGKHDGLTLAHGAVAAKGGANGGDGGRVETSGPSIDIDGFLVDTRSASPSSGKTGLWLIDPYDYRIGLSQADAIVSGLISSNVEVTTTNNVASYGSNGNSASNGNIWIDANINSNSVNSLTLKSHKDITHAAGVTVSTNGGSVTYWADSDNNGIGTIRFDGAATINTNGGNITLAGGADSGGSPAGYAGQIYAAGTFSANSHGGNILVKSRSSGTDYSSAFRGATNFFAGSGSITMDAQQTGSVMGLLFSTSVNITSSKTSGTAINLSGTANTSYGVVFNGGAGVVSTIKSTGAGAITINGSSTSPSSGSIAGIYLFADVLSGSGPITLNGGAAGITMSSSGTSVIGQKAGQVNASSSNISLVADRIDSTAANTGLSFDSSGQASITSSGASFSNTLNTAGLTFGSTLSGLTLGQSGNTQSITLTGATSIAGPISLIGGDITLNAGLTASGTNIITLQGSGNVTDGASGFVNATNLRLLSGNVTLDSASNAIGTIAASGVSGLTFVDSTALTVGTLSGTVGISASGGISLTSTDLTLNNGITGTNTITLQGSGNVTDGASGFVNATNLRLLSGNVTLDGASNDVATIAASGVSNLTYVDSNALAVGTVTTVGISATGAVSLTGTNVTVGANVTSTATTGTGFSINGTSIKQNSGITVSTSGSNVAYTASNSPLTSGGDVAIDLNRSGGTATTINAGGGNIDINASFASSGAASTTTDYAIAARDFRILTSGNGTINITADASNNTATGAVTGLWMMGSKVITGAGAINITGTGGKASNASSGVTVDWKTSVSSASGAITLTDTRAVGLTGTYAGMTIAGGPTADKTFIGANGVDVVNSSSAITLRADALNFSNQISNHSNVNLLTTGTITLESVGTTFSSAVKLGSASYLGPTFGSTVGTVTIGKATSTANIDLYSAITSSGNISVSGGNVTIGAGLTAASGTVTLKGTGDVTDGASGFVSATNLLLTGGNVTLDSTSNAIGTIAASGVSNLTYVDSNDLTVGTVTTVGITASGAVALTGSNLTLGANVTTTGSSGAVVLKATGGITSSANITTNGGDITLWSNAATNTTTGSSVGGININDNVVLDSRTAADRTASTHTTGGGAITLGGGSATGSTAKGTTVPTGYAMNYSTTDSGLILGTNSLNSKVSGVRLLSGGGHISVSGRSNQVNIYTVGIKAYEGLTVNAGTSGNITLTGLADAAPSTISAGIDLQSYNSAATNTNAALASSFTTANGAIVLTGVTTSTAASNGLQINPSSLTTGVTVQATGTGSITLNGSTQGTASDFSARFTNLLAASGNITLNGNGLSSVSLRGVNVGRLSGSSVTASSSNITVNANLPSFHTTTSNFNTSGTVTIQPVGTSFSSAITFPGSFLTFSSDVSALTLGKSGNTANVIVDSPVSIAGPINVIAGDITLNAGLTATGTNTITLQGSGNVTDGASGFVNAANLLLTGGNVTLDSTSNAIGTIAASGVSNLTYVDSNALIVGTVGSTSGIGASGGVTLTATDLTLNNGITATGTNTITLKGSGNVTDGASGFVSATNLLLTSGNVTLDSTSNAIGTIAASGVSNLTYVDSNALIVGTVGSTSGISATGGVSLTSTDLTLNNGITATGTNTITLQGSGNVTDGASGFVNATHLRLLSGNVTLDSASNAIGTIAASGVSNLTYVDSNDLAVGTVTTVGITASGAVALTGSNLTLGANVTTSGSSGAVLLKATGRITSSANITTNGGDITLWSNSATNTTTGSSVGGININDNVVLDSRTAADRTASTHTIGGGAITLGGGSVTTTTANGSTVPSDYAMNAATESGLMLGTNPVSRASNIQINSGGGHISLRGRTNQYVGNLVGIAAYEGLKINAGTTGNITLSGLANLADTSLAQAGVDLQMYRNGGVAASTSATAASSFTTVNGNIVLTGITNSTNTASNGFQAGGSAVASALTLQATGTGSITINGSSQTLGSIRGDIWLNANVNLLAASGNITLNGQGLGGVLVGGINVGRLDNSSVTTSSSNITINTNWWTPFNTTSNFRTSGAVTVQPVSNNFASTLNFPNSLVALSSDVSGLTLGKDIGSTAHTDTVNFGAATSIAGPIQVFAGNITVNGPLSTTSGSSGAVLLKATGGITSSANITTDGGDITLWSNSATNTSTGSSVGGIQINNSVVLDSRTAADRTASTHTTGGGAITLGGGSVTTTTANGSTVPNGYAMNISNKGYGLRLGTDGDTGHVSNIQINSGGGNIFIGGRSNEQYSYTLGLVAHEGLKVNAGTTGNITLKGMADHVNPGNQAGIDLQSGRTGADPASTSVTAASSFTTANGAIVVTGITPRTASNGVQMVASAAASAVTMQATGTGSITINGSSQLASASGGDLVLHNVNLLAASGNITLNATGLGAAWINGVNAGRLSGSSVTTSSSSITLNTNWLTATNSSSNFATTGTVTIQSVGNNFTGVLNFPSSLISLSSDVSGLTLGKDIGSTAHTDTVNVEAATSIAGPISIYAGTIGINQSLTATGSNTITLKGGTVTDGASGSVSADKLLLLAGNVTLDSTNNAIGTLAASGVSSLTYIDSDALAIGTVGARSGIAATGTISVSTLTGNLTLGANVTTTNTTATAILLNAGSSSAAGTRTGGDIIVQGTPVLTAGSGGTIRLMTGSLDGSTGLLDLVGSGTGRFRYNSDEVSNGYATALGTNVLNAIYRERPDATISGSSAQTITYGDSYTLPGSAAGLVNGDSLTLSVASPLFSSTNLLRYSATPYSVTSNLAALGYNVSGSMGTLTVNRKALSFSGLSSANKIYDGNTTATVSGSSALLASVATGSGTSIDGSRYTGDVLSLSGTPTASFDTKNVATATTVSFTGLSLSGADSGNYTLTPHATEARHITSRALTVAYAGVNKIYDGLTSTTVTTTDDRVSGDVLNIARTAEFANQHAGLAKTVNVSNVSLSGAEATNYNLVSATGSTTADISAATLTATLTNNGVTKVYDGTTNGPTALVPTFNITGFITGDTSANLAAAAANYNSADVSAANTLTVSGLSIGSVTGTNGSLASDYVLSASSQSVAAVITKAPLTVKANNDSRFVVQSESPSFAGVSYSGFVNGETSTALTGTLGITRTNSGVNSAGSYSNVLVASGLTADNYNITFAPGNFTIVPSNQLMVRVTDVSSAYGTTTPYQISSIEYENGGTIYNLGSGGVSGSSVAVAANNLVSINDGSSGAASFTLAPMSAVMSTAGKLAKGSYQIGITGAVTENSNNFSNTITVVGAHQVTTKSIAASVSNVTKIYDGTTAVSGATFNLSTLESGDVVNMSSTGTFSSKNAGTGLSYAINNLTLNGTDASNYHLSSGSSLNGTNGAITPRNLTVNFTGVDKVYDGNASATVTTTDNRIGGDVLGLIRTANFADKNVGAGKVVSITGLSLSGTDAGNYSVASTGTATANITRLNAASWVGGATGNWFDPANWAGGAVPDLSNVANVVIPAGTNVGFGSTVLAPAQSGPVNIDSLGSASGSLAQTDGTLNVGSGGMSLSSYTQSGGTLASVGSMALGSLAQTGGSLSTANDLTVTQAFSQGTAGTINVDGNTRIANVSGPLVIGNLSSTGTTQISNTGGDLTQAVGTALISGGIATLAASHGGLPAAITLDNADNDFQAAVNATGSSVSLRDTNALSLGTLTTTGDLTLNSNGPLNLGNSSVGGNLSATSGNGNVTQSGAITVAGLTNLSAGSGNVTLTDAGNHFIGNITVQANLINIVGSILTPNPNTVVQVPTPSIGTAVSGVSVIASPGTGLSNSTEPQPLAMGLSTASYSSSASSNSATAGNSAGVAIDVRDAPATETAITLMAAVSLPKDTATLGTGFSFELPETVRKLAQEGTVSTANLSNGAPLPVWLKFDASALRFQASAVPDNAFPLQVLVTVGGQRVLVVISERAE